MKIALYVLAVLLILAGAVWFLQGLNILLGSFMSGQPQWALYGGLTVVAGIVLAVWNHRRS